MKNVCVYAKNGDIEEILNEISRHDDWIFDVETDLYSDGGISSTSTKNRVEFNAMIERAKAGRYDLIVVKDICDFMRNAELTFELIDELEKCGVAVYLVNTGVWSFNKDDFLLCSINCE